MNLNGVPGGGELWKVGNKTYLVYTTPGSNKIPMAWRVHDRAQIQALFGPGQSIRYARELTAKQARSRGLIYMGVREDLSNSSEHPFRSLMGKYKQLVKANPFLADPEVFAHYAAATLEGRTLTMDDLKATNWFRSRNEQQRAWAILRLSDPKEADRIKADNRHKINMAFREAGAWGTPKELVHIISDWVTNGRWSEDYAMRQIRALADPHSRIPLDRTMRNWAKQIQEYNIQGEAEVRELVRTWLGPAAMWSDKQVSEWAGRLRNDAAARDRLTEMLSKQRLALFPEYEDASLTYEDIAAPWRGLFTSVWGQQADETDGLFTKVVRMNDAGEAQKLLVREGLDRDIHKVKFDTLGSMSRAFGSGVSASAI